MLRNERAQEKSRHVLVALDKCIRCGLAHIRTGVARALLDGKNDNVGDHGDIDAAENAQGHGTNKRIRVGEVLLEGIDAEKGEVGLGFCIAEEVDVDEFADLEVLGGDVLDDVRKELSDIASLGDKLHRNQHKSSVCRVNARL